MLRLKEISRGEIGVRGVVTGLSVLLGCFALALIAGSAFLLPSGSDAVGADVTISVDPLLQMTVTPNVDLTLTPSSSGTLSTGDIDVDIATNNATGYTLTMNATTATNVDLWHANLTDKITNSANSSAAALAVNTWGYNIKSGATPTTFLAVPAPTAPANIETTSVPGTDTHTITVAANVDTNIPSGYYSGLLTFTAVGNYVPEPVRYMQDVEAGACPYSRTRMVDARDGNTYWVQKLADGKCWMLTNLAYAGGGTNTYGDTKNITTSNTVDYAQPYYMVPTGSAVTSGTTDPSTSTTGIGQYGYLYNWCAAMGAQTSTSACANATTPAPDASISICPSGWRLPTGNTGGEFQSLANAIGATSNAQGSTTLRSTWLGMYGGYWSDGFYDQGSDGYYWSSTQYDATVAWTLAFYSSNVYPGTYNHRKLSGFAVRCIAS